MDCARLVRDKNAVLFQDIWCLLLCHDAKYEADHHFLMPNFMKETAIISNIHKGSVYLITIEMLHTTKAIDNFSSMRNCFLHSEIVLLSFCLIVSKYHIFFASSLNCCVGSVFGYLLFYQLNFCVYQFIFCF